MQVTNTANYDQHIYKTILENQDAICEAALKRVTEDFRKENEINSQSKDLPNGCSTIYTYTYQGAIVSYRVRRHNMLHTTDPYRINPPAFHKTEEYHEVFKKTLTSVVGKLMRTPECVYLADLLIDTEQEQVSSSDTLAKMNTRRFQLVQNPTNIALTRALIKDLVGSTILQNATILAMRPYEQQAK